MKLTVFQSNKGDCLLLNSQDDKNMLVDGGTSSSYRKHVAPSLSRFTQAGRPIDLVYVSHIDDDHIGGILKMMDDLVAWRIYDYQNHSGNKKYPKPKIPRPPQLQGIWHNAFKDMVEDNRGEIEDQLVANAKILNMSPEVIGPQLAAHAPASSDLATSVKQGLQLSSRVGPQQLKIPVNAEFGGRVICVDGPLVPLPLGTVSLRVLGPFKEDLENLREDWNEWLDGNKKVVEEIRSSSAEDAQLMTEGQAVLSSMLSLANELSKRNLVTPPNLASLMLLAEEGGKTVLLTGDGHADDILKGLGKNGKLDDQGRIHVNVLKVQHHGSENNIHAKFCRSVTADHYVFCGNGAHHNPDLDALQTLFDARLGENTDNPHAHQPFALWFNSSAKVSDSQEGQDHMQKVEKLVKQAASHSGGKMKYKFLKKGSLFELRI